MFRMKIAPIKIIETNESPISTRNTIKQNFPVHRKFVFGAILGSSSVEKLLMSSIPETGPETAGIT
jgi:hypothetical protein